MAFNENSINDQLNSKAFAIVMILALIGCSLVNDNLWDSGMAIAGTNGLLFPSLAGNIGNTAIATATNVVCAIATGVLLYLLNQTFSFIRSTTAVFSSVFLLLMASSPITSGRLYSGTVMCLTAVLLAFLVFASFQQRRAQRSVFTAFALVTTLSLFQYAYLYLLLALVLSFMLMRIMNLRSILAMAIGIITPLWIVFGLQLASFSDFSLPTYQTQSLWDVMQSSQIHISFISIILLVVFTIALTIANLLKIINYKLQVRAFNGFFVYLTVLTIAMLAIDYRNAFAYLPVLYLCFSVQFAHFFTINTHTRRYVAALVLIAAVVAFRIIHIFI